MKLKVLVGEGLRVLIGGGPGVIDLRGLKGRVSAVQGMMVLYRFISLLENHLYLNRL